jgi:hypothetical protein
VKTKPISSSRSAWGFGDHRPSRPRRSPRICQRGAGTPGVDLGAGRHAKAGETRIPGVVAGGTRRFLSDTVYANLITGAQVVLDSGTPSHFVVKLAVAESSACICKKSLTESISDSNL